MRFGQLYFSLTEAPLGSRQMNTGTVVKRRKVGSKPPTNTNVYGVTSKSIFEA